MATIRRAEKRIDEAHKNDVNAAEIEAIEQEHIDKLNDMLAEPMSANVVEDSF